MREMTPWRPKKSCAAAMSMTAVPLSHFGGHRPGDLERLLAHSRLDDDAITAPSVEPGGRRRTDEDHPRPQHVERVVRRADQRGRDRGGSKHVDAVDAQRLVAAGEARVDFHDRTRHGDPRLARDGGIHRLVEPGARPADLEVRGSGHRAHAADEFVDGRAVDQRDRETERHAQGDGKHAQREAAAVASERAAKRGASHGQQLVTPARSNRAPRGPPPTTAVRDRRVRPRRASA